MIKLLITLIFLMTPCLSLGSVYLLVNEPNSHWEKFDGMTQAQVTAMQDARGKTYTIKTKAQYEVVFPPGYAIYVIAGQSNSLYMGQQEADNFLSLMNLDLNYSTTIVCGVGSTAMSRWVGDGTGDLYNIMIALITSMKEAHAQSHVAGLLFWQGESDADGGINTTSWPQRFTDMVAYFRADIIDPNKRVVFAQITDTGGEARDLFRTLQAGISIDNVSMVVTDGITQLGDHTDEAGYTTMINRFATAMKALQ